MSELMRNQSVAYTKGHREAIKWNGKLTNCPYGQTKYALMAWWCAGFHDTKSNNIDFNMLLTTPENKDDD